MKKLLALLALLLPALAQAQVTLPYNGGGGAGGAVTVTAGANSALVPSNVCQVIIRSNSGSAMNDTLPNAVTASKGCITLINTDASATDTITPTTSTIGGGATFALLAGQAATVYNDGTNYQAFAGNPLVPGAASVTSLTASGAVAANAITSSTTVIATGKISSGDAVYSTGGTLPTSTPGQGAFVGDASVGLRMQGNGSANDIQMLNSNGSLICQVGHGTNTISCQQFAVTGTSVAGNGIYRPVSTQLGFSSNGLSAGVLDAGQHPRFGGSGTPTITSGACGTGSNGTIVAGSGDIAGQINIAAAATTTCTVSFNKTYDTAPRAVVLTPANSAAAGQVANVFIAAADVTTTTFKMTGTALASTNWHYHVE